MKEINQTVNVLAEDKKEKVDAALKILTEKTKDINNISTTVSKLVAEKKEEERGINNLERKVNEIKELLNPLIPTLGFAKECIEIVGGDKKILDGLRAYRNHEMLKEMVMRMRSLEGENNEGDQMDHDDFDGQDIANAEEAEKNS